MPLSNLACILINPELVMSLSIIELWKSSLNDYEWTNVKLFLFIIAVYMNLLQIFRNSIPNKQMIWYL